MIADEDFEPPDLGNWKALQTWIETGPTAVTVPYGKLLASLVPPIAVRLRRDFGAVLNLVRSHALIHRASRERDEQGRVLASIDDYVVVRNLVSDLISAMTEATVTPLVRETVNTVETMLEQTGHTSVNIRQVGVALNLDYSPAHRRVKLAEERGYLTRRSHARRHRCLAHTRERR